MNENEKNVSAEVENESCVNEKQESKTVMSYDEMKKLFTDYVIKMKNVSNNNIDSIWNPTARINAIACGRNIELVVKATDFAPEKRTISAFCVSDNVRYDLKVWLKEEGNQSGWDVTGVEIEEASVSRVKAALALPDFDEFLSTANDGIDNAAYALLTAMSGNEELEWDQYYLGQLKDAAESILRKMTRENQICYPFYGENDEPCFIVDGECTNKNCPYNEFKTEKHKCENKAPVKTPVSVNIPVSKNQPEKNNDPYIEKMIEMAKRVSDHFGGIPGVAVYGYGENDFDPNNMHLGVIEIPGSMGFDFE